MPRGRKKKKSSQPSQVAKETCNHEEVDEGKDSLQGDIKERSSDEDTGGDPSLEQKHKIFLSHSGAQKDIVYQLCEALEARCHYPFFDRRPDSLPKGERFPGRIVQAAKQCEMMIVVVSDEYFMSKWPMIELNAFVRAHKLCCESKGLDGGPKILPLFYGLSVSDLEDTARRRKWFREWESLAKADPKKRIVVNEWKSALDILGSFNGVVYDRVLKESTAYIREIVSAVCKSIVPDIKWDDSHVQGKSSICKAICEKMDGIGNSEKFQVKVGGIYGVGGIGKTTICHILCNELSNKYEGRVCHIEFQSEASKDSKEVLKKYYKELLQKVLIELSGKSKEAIQRLNEGQCKDILYKSLSKQRVFLAIDNVWDDPDSKEQAKMYLEAPYHKDSLVMVTSRSKHVLKDLGIEGDAWLEMPELGKDDAEKLFRQHAAHGKQEFEAEELECISMCVERCHFSKGAGEGLHYHPLALKVLGLLMSCHQGSPREWVEHLPRVQTFSNLSKKNPVFDILGSSFDALELSLQTLFMDVGFFCPRIHHRENAILEWLCDVRRQKDAEIKPQLDLLKTRGLLQDVDLASGRVSMHDLYREFGELELRGKLKESTDLGERRWMYVEDVDMTDLERKPAGKCWQKVTRLAFAFAFPDSDEDSDDGGGVECVKGIKWKYFCNVEVLRLEGLDWKWGALNLEPMQGLRSLDINHVKYLYGIEGLEGLKYLIHMRWVYDDWLEKETDIPIVGLLPKSLKALEINEANAVLQSDLLTQCSNLSKLKFCKVSIDTLDLRSCRSLDSINLSFPEKCQALLLPSADRPSCLRSLQVTSCNDLVDIPGIDRLTNLRELRVIDCWKLKLPSLLALTQLQVLELEGTGSLKSAKDCIPGQLRKLRYVGKRAVEEVNLDEFNQLEDLYLSGTHGLTSLGVVGGLPALQRLALFGCKNLVGLPDLSKSRHLECLRVSECKDLVDIPGIDRLTKLRELRVSRCPKLKVPSLLALTQLQTLELCGEPSVERAKDCIPGQLRELRYLGKRAVEEVNLDGFNQLEVLDLSETHGLTSLEAVGGLPALRRLDLSRCKNLLGLPDLSKSRHLERLLVTRCKILVDIPGIDRVTNLRELHVAGCPKLKVPSLLALTQLQSLKLCGEPSLERGKDCIPGQLRELRYLGKRAVEEVNLEGFNQLEVLDLSGTHGLTSLEAVGGLPTLRHLDLMGCRLLLELPDLSKSKNLGDLCLRGCLSLELHGRDIGMLLELPLLRLDLGYVYAAGFYGFRFTLDLVCWKVRIHAWAGQEHEKEQERDLGVPPIKIRYFEEDYLKENGFRRRTMTNKALCNELSNKYEATGFPLFNS